ncbi:unnamed protein product [Lasius platythorax]|uniref:Uncharacterized protein n=1 Tax=Lasius platythorax TaxID=488582 RepID=A0AAV2N4S6_9HYME
MAAVHHLYERTGDVIRLADVLKVVLSRHVDENEWRFPPVFTQSSANGNFTIFQRLRILTAANLEISTATNSPGI